MDNELPDPEKESDFDPDECQETHPELMRELQELFRHINQPDTDQEAKGAAGERRVLGDFQIIRLLGTGGMARVYEAEQLSLKRRVALKVLSLQLSLSDRAVSKFFREGEAASRQNHPGIVSIFTVGEEDGNYYIAQELVPEGRTLADAIEACRRLPALPLGYFQEIALIFLRTAQALAHAHATGVIHRDVKPTNILLTPEGRPKITDFGLALVEDATSLSRTGDASGTPNYMAPEQVENRRDQIDERTDIFSLGISLYESLTLKRPFMGPSSHDVASKIIAFDPRDPHKINPRISRDLSMICLKAMEKKPEHRYPTMEAFVRDLQYFLAGETVSARSPSLLRKSRHWFRRHKLTALALAASLVAVLALSILIFQFREERLREQALLEDRFKISKEALGFPDFLHREDPASVSLRAAPKDPGGYLLLGISALESGANDQAMERIRQGLERCLPGEDPLLVKDGHYLLALALRRRAERVEDAEERTKLLQEAEIALKRSRIKAEDIPESLLRRPDPAETSPWFQAPLLLNTDHFLIHLYHGLHLFERLYKGGNKREFESALEHLEKVLEKRPDHLTALPILGRVQFFFARCYNYNRWLDEARAHLQRALTLTPDRPFNLTPITLGQIELLRGNNQKAREYLTFALEKCADQHCYLHNAHRYLGTVCIREGRFEESLDWFLAAQKRTASDPSAQIGLARYHLHMGDLDTALEHAIRSMTVTYFRTGSTQPSRLVDSYLTGAQVQFARKHYKDAFKHLNTMTDPVATILFPRDLALGCFLVATLPETVLNEKWGRFTGRGTAENLARVAHFEAGDSFFSAAALGISAWLNKEDQKAIRFLEQARERLSQWPQTMRENYRAADAHLCYFLAMAHERHDPVSEQGEVFFQRAEAIYALTDPLRIDEYHDFLQSAREKACRVFSKRP